MARNFNGTSDFGLVTTCDLSGTDNITIVIRLQQASYADNDDLMCELSPNFNSTTGAFIVDPNSSSTKWDVSLKGNVGHTNAQMTRPSTGVYHTFVCLLDIGAASSEWTTVYFDGSSQSINRSSDSNNTANLKSDELNIMCRNSASLFLAGDLATFCIFEGSQLTAAQAQAISNGVPPFALGLAMRCYFEFWGHSTPELDYSGNGETCAITGTTKTDHPAVELMENYL